MVSHVLGGRPAISTSALDKHIAKDCQVVDHPGDESVQLGKRHSMAEQFSFMTMGSFVNYCNRAPSFVIRNHGHVRLGFFCVH